MTATRALSCWALALAVGATGLCTLWRGTAYRGQMAPKDSAVAMSVEPATGDGAEKTFVLRYKPGKSRTLREARILFNASLDGRGGCYVYYDRGRNSFLLVDDSGTSSTRLDPGSADFLANSQCRLDGSQSTVQENNGTLRIALALKFYSAFPGQKNVYLYAETEDGWNSGLQLRGDWSVPSSHLLGTSQ